MDDAAALAGTSAAEAIPRLVDRYGGKLYRLGVQVCGSEDEAEDLVQDVLTAAFRKWDQFEGRAEPSTWLYTIAVRACQRRHRRRSGEPSRLASLEELLPDAAAATAIVPEADDPLRAAVRREAHQRVSSAIAALPLTFRLPLVLKEIAELPVEEVAAILGLKPATVKTRLHRARLKLRAALEAGLPRRPAPPPDHQRRVCLDLLRSKQEALDRGVSFSLPAAELCARCRSLFATLDLTHEVCTDLGRGELPASLRRLVAAETKHTAS